MPMPSTTPFPSTSPSYQFFKFLLPPVLLLSYSSSSSSLLTFLLLVVLVYAFNPMFRPPLIRVALSPLRHPTHVAVSGKGPVTTAASPATLAAPTTSTTTVPMLHLIYLLPLLLLLLPHWLLLLWPNYCPRLWPPSSLIWPYYNYDFWQFYNNYNYTSSIQLSQKTEKRSRRE